MLDDTGKLAFSPREAAARLGVPVLHIREALRNGELSAHQIKPGSRALITRDALLAWFTSHPTPYDRRRKVQPYD